MAGERILVVDDDQGLLTLMKMRLEAAGYKAITAEGAEQALSRQQDDPCDVAIVDLKLPGINGIALLEKLLHRHPHLPVIILTAHGSIASAVEATKKGAYDYLTKPFDPKDLLHRIEKAVEVRRLRGEVEQLRTLVQERYDSGQHHCCQRQDAIRLAAGGTDRCDRFHRLPVWGKWDGQGADWQICARDESPRTWAICRDQLRCNSRGPPRK